MRREIRLYDPFERIRKLQEEMDDLFENFMTVGRKEWSIRSPLSDLVDKGNSFELRVELPGVEKEDIKITADKNSVSVSAERKIVDEEKKKNYYYCERSYTGYKRVFGLPEEIDPNKVDAEFKNGVLTISLPKVAASAPKKEITV
ncbi:MAG: Hsp20/alpha crystallin family protein, partial [Candidatus Bilamarchaeaceae archaeon]